VPYINNQNKKICKVSFEHCQFDKPDKNQLNTNKLAKGETIGTNYNDFKPKYQYYSHE
jgi:hypothetical protein